MHASPSFIYITMYRIMRYVFSSLCLNRWVRTHTRAKHHPHSLILLHILTRGGIKYSAFQRHSSPGASVVAPVWSTLAYMHTHWDSLYQISNDTETSANLL